MGQLLEQTADLGDGPDPVANLRALSLALFDEMRRRPWFGGYMMRNTGLQRTRCSCSTGSVSS